MPTRAPVPDSLVARTDAFLRDVTRILQRIESQVAALCAASRLLLAATQPKPHPRAVRRRSIPKPSQN